MSLTYFCRCGAGFEAESDDENHRRALNIFKSVHSTPECGSTDRATALHNWQVREASLRPAPEPRP
jgi:hypothetical protein